MNINRDYLIINDVKKSNVKLDNGSIFFYITDKNTQNIFVNLVINVSNNDLIQKYANIENAEDYTLTMNIVKPDNTYKIVEGKLHDKEKAIFEFDLEEDCCDKIGTYKCELLTKCSINEQEEITTSNSITYKVKKSVLNDLDDIVEAPEYPLVIQLFDKLSDINQYEEDRRANELARQLAEEQRQTRFNTLDADMVDRVNAMDSKMDDVEARISAKEQAVDKLIVDTKADIDDYKVAKDTEIDEYKATKDTEINNAITAQDNKIDQAITNQNNKIDDAVANQNNKIDTAVAEQNNRIGIIEANDNTQNTRLDALEAKDIAHETSITNIEAKNVEQDNRLDSIEAVNVSQDNRLDAIEIKNQQQDDRLLNTEKVNKRQDMDLKCLFAESKNNMIDITEEGNSVYLQNSTVGYTLIDEIQGNTMVNCNKEADKEITLNGNINTQGYSNVTLTEGVDGGLVDVALEGNTMVNVCNQKDPVAITKSYTVETGNHVALQGEYDGKCRPVVTGNTLVNCLDFKNYISKPEEIVIEGNKLIFNGNGSFPEIHYNPSIFKPNTEYTIIGNVEERTEGVGENQFMLFRIGEGDGTDSINANIHVNTVGKFKIKFTTPTNIVVASSYLRNSVPTGERVVVSELAILEGDYTNKPLPDYFEGLQSSFEDKVVTQEMVDNGEELAENLDKYRVDYIVTGKNKFNNNEEGVVLGAYRRIQIYDKNTNVTVSLYDNDTSVDITGCYLGYINENTEFMGWFVGNGTIYNTICICKNFGSIQIHPNTQEVKDKLCARFNIQIEEGSTATTYEPYKEYKKTFYLNSPLLEGDTIEQQGDNVVHVHRSEIRAYQTDDELTLPTDMTNTLVAKATPQYEVISQNDTILCDSYVNGHLDVDSAVPIEKVDFLHFEEELTYLYANTQYAVQFVSNAVSKVDITLGGAKLLNQNVAVGTNKINITTPSELIDNNLVLNGIGFNASNIVVTEATDQDFGYFEGMKSVGECEGNKIEILSRYHYIDYHSNNNSGHHIKPIWNFSTKSISGYLQYFNEVPSYNQCNNLFDFYYIGGNSSLWINLGSFDPYEAFETLNIRIAEGEGKINKKEMTHEPLRAVGDIKDKYVLIDGKWHIERNCGEVVLDGVTNSGFTRLKKSESKNGYTKYPLTREDIKENSNIICETLKKASDVAGGTRPFSCIIAKTGSYKLMLNLPIELVGTNDESMNSYLQNNNIRLVMELATPQYEPIDYNPFTVYSDTTHISNNSTIPANMVIKNTGYNCLLKPSTTYTVSSNLGLNTVTTPSVLSEDCLRFMDTDTSDVTTMKNVLVLEGDWTTKADLIPANFSGIESAFEQEYDAEKGKYKVNVKIANVDKSKENNITFYINKPLRGVGTAKDRVYVKDDKLMIERNYIIKTVDGSENGWSLMKDNNRNITFMLRNDLFADANIDSLCICNLFTRDITGGLIKADNSMRITEYGGVERLFLVPTKEKCSDLQSFKQWLQQNPVTVVYQLAEPTYEEVEYNDVKLFIESFKNSTLFYNSNVPVTSKVWYSFSIPIVEKVSALSAQADKQEAIYISILDEEVNK